VWNISADYAVHSDGGAIGTSNRFIYTTRVRGKYEERNPNLEDAIAGEIAIDNVAARSISPEPIPQDKSINR
jgi:hypothetical protein